MKLCFNLFPQQVVAIHLPLPFRSPANSFFNYAVARHIYENLDTLHPVLHTKDIPESRTRDTSEACFPQALRASSAHHAGVEHQLYQRGTGISSVGTRPYGG